MTNTNNTARNVKNFGGLDIDVIALRAAVDANDWHTVIDMTSGSCHIVVNSIWSAAMTARYGRGVHPSRCDEHGCPTAETLAQFPRIARAQAEAAKQIREWYMWRLERDDA